MKLLIIFEKKSQQLAYMENISFQSLIENKETTIILTKMLTNYRFKYPNAKYNEYPFTKEVQYINTDIYDYNELEENYDELIIATDFDYVGMFSADKILTMKKGINWKNKFKKITIFNTSYAISDNKDNSIKDEINILKKDCSTYMSDFDNFVKEAKVKYYFDYNYNYNSQVFFKEILKKSNIGNNKNIGITKNMILILWQIKKNKSLSSPIKILKFMSNYEGSGKYINKEIGDDFCIYSIGTQASMSPIIKNLIDLNLLNENFSISEHGKIFLSKLVKQTFDPDLPMRINEFQKLELSEGYQKIDKYILSTFVKQKNKNKSL